MIDNKDIKEDHLKNRKKNLVKKLFSSSNASRLINATTFTLAFALVHEHVIENNLNLNSSLVDYNGKNVFHYASAGPEQFGHANLFKDNKKLYNVIVDNDIDQFKKMIENGDIDLHEKDSEGRTIIHWLAANGGEEIISIAVSQGAKIDARDKFGNTPFLYAINNGNEYAAQVLVENGADPHAVNIDGSNAYHLVKNPMTVLYLKELDIDINATNKMELRPIQNAILKNDIFMFVNMSQYGADIDSSLVDYAKNFGHPNMHYIVHYELRFHAQKKLNEGVTYREAADLGYKLGVIPQEVYDKAIYKYSDEYIAQLQADLDQIDDDSPYTEEIQYLVKEQQSKGLHQFDNSCRPSNPDNLVEILDMIDYQYKRAGVKRKTLISYFDIRNRYGEDNLYAGHQFLDEINKYYNYVKQKKNNDIHMNENRVFTHFINKIEKLTAENEYVENEIQSDDEQYNIS